MMADIKLEELRSAYLKEKDPKTKAILKRAWRVYKRFMNGNRSKNGKDKSE